MTEKPKREKDATGREILVHSSGMIQDAATGHILRGPKETPINSTTARGLNSKRYENVRAKTRKEILRLTQEALPDAKIENEDDAYSAGAALVWKKSVLNPKAYPRDQINALETVGKIAGFVPKANEVEPTPEGIQLMANISTETFLAIAEALEAKKNANVV